MDITLNKKTNTNASIKVTLNEADYQSKVDEKLKDYSKKAQIKGFRPGKVPPTLIKKMYGKSVLVDEISSMLNASLTKFIKENKLPIVGEPLPDNDQKTIDWDNQSQFEFEYNLGLHSEFNYDLSKLSPQTKSIIYVDEAEINSTLERLRAQYGKMEPVESSEKGDYIHGELNSADGSYTQTVVLPTNKVEESEINKFLGVAKDQTIDFDIKKIFADDNTKIATFLGIPKEEAENLIGNFKLMITEVKRTMSADLNQDFFDTIFGKDAVSNEEEFLTKMKDTLQINYSAEADALLTRNIYSELINTTDIELPEDFLKEYLFIVNQGKFTKEAIEKDFPGFLKEMKWGLIRNKLLKDNEIKVDDNDLKEEARRVMKSRLSQLGSSPEMNDLLNTLADNYLKAENGKNVNSLIENILFNKTISFVKENITIEEKVVDKEEFTKLASN